MAGPFDYSTCLDIILSIINCMWLKNLAHRYFGLPYRLHIRQYGTKGPRIIFLHGIAANSKIWLPIVKQLQSQYRCIVIDLLGHGASPKPTNISYTADDQARSLAWTLFWSGNWGKSLLVAHSMGNIVGCRFMVKHPRLITGYVSIAMPIYLRRNNLDQPQRLEGYLDAVYLTFYRGIRKLPPDSTIKSAQAIVKRMPQVFGSATLSEHNWYPIVSSLANTIENQDLISDIQKLPANLPIKVLYGLLDNLVIATNIKNVFSKRQNSRIVKMSAGHEMTKIVVAQTIKAIQQLSVRS